MSIQCGEWIARVCGLKPSKPYCRAEASQPETHALNSLTASTQRPHRVGCSLCEPTSVSQCQQRSHFWPSAWTTNSDPLSLVISNCETLHSSRNASSTACSPTHSDRGLLSAY